MAKQYKIYLGIVNASIDALTTKDGIDNILNDVKIDIYEGAIRSMIHPSNDTETNADKVSTFIARLYARDLIDGYDVCKLLDYSVQRIKEVNIAKGSDN